MMQPGIAVHSGETIAERNSLRVLDCRECGFAHLAADAIPSPEVLARFYARDFWQRDKAGWRERYEAQADWLAAIHGDWLSLVEYCTLGRTLLDVGCGWGFFMAAAQARGWSALGVDHSPEAVEASRKKVGHDRVIISSWEATKWMDQWYDCLSCLWLIEHLPDPLTFLRWAHDCLYSGGVLLVACPNEWTDLQEKANRIAAVKSYWLDHTHINYFSAASLSNLLGRAGFVVVDRLGTYPMENHILGGRDYAADPALGEEAHALVRKVDLAQTREQRLDFGRALGRKGAGRDMVLICRPC